jgi:hypothetical protein
MKSRGKANVDLKKRVARFQHELHEIFHRKWEDLKYAYHLLRSYWDILVDTGHPYHRHLEQTLQELQERHPGDG